LLGFDDYTCLMCGLLYGIVVVCASGYMLNAVLAGGTKLPQVSRWFVAFMNFEIVAFVGIALAKLPKLCKVQNEYLPKLEMQCELLKFLYIQRIAFLTIVAGFSCWVFSSLAYFLAFGFQAIDRPEYADHLDLHEAHAGAEQAGQQHHGLFGAIPENYPAASFAHSLAAPGTRQSMAPGSIRSLNPRPVGEAIQVGPLAGSRAAGSRAGSLRALEAMSSRDIASSGGLRPSYNIPRASSSLTTSASSSPGGYGGETQPFIKNPVAVF
jgi:hypothetical protein